MSMPQGMEIPRKRRIMFPLAVILVLALAGVSLFVGFGVSLTFDEQERTIQSQQMTISDLQYQLQTRIAELNNKISALNVALMSDQQIINLQFVNNLGTKTFTIQPSPLYSAQCSYKALTTFLSWYAGYMVLSGYASSEHVKVYVTYNTGLEDATSWFVASAGTSTINATVPLYPSLVTVWVLNCDNVPVSGSITVVVHW